jgi:DNA-binding IclR family transcriptional regulator
MIIQAKPRSKAPSVSQAVAILRHLAAQEAPSGAVAIARALGISPSSCFNILKVLTGECFVNFDQTRKTYTLGSGAVGLARHALDPENAGYIGRDVLLALAREYEATCTMWRVTADERILLVAREASDKAATLRMRIGQRLPFMIGANGRSILATVAISTRELRPKFAKLQWDAPPSFDEYLAQVQIARRVGWGLDEGSYMRGVTTVASAITDHGGSAQFSVAITFLGAQHKKSFLQQVGHSTVSAAQQLKLTLYGPARRG